MWTAKWQAPAGVLFLPRQPMSPAQGSCWLVKRAACHWWQHCPLPDFPSCGAGGVCWPQVQLHLLLAVVVLPEASQDLGGRWGARTHSPCGPHRLARKQNWEGPRSDLEPQCVGRMVVAREAGCLHCWKAAVAHLWAPAASVSLLQADPAIDWLSLRPQLVLTVLQVAMEKHSRRPEH